MRGFIYILSNPSLPGLLKIGKTSKDPKTRGDELYATGIPTPFKLEYMAFCDDMDTLEIQVHKKLESYRPNKDREFFKVSRMTAINVIQKEGKNSGELKFEEKNFKSVDDFWELTQLLHNNHKERCERYKDRSHDKEVYNVLTKKEYPAVQKPSAKEHVIILPPKTRPISFKSNNDEGDEFGSETIWKIHIFEDYKDGKPPIALTEQQFEEEIENKFAKTFPGNSHETWVLGTASDFAFFSPLLDDEPYYDWAEEEIITSKVKMDRIKTKTTKLDLEKKKKEEEKQRILSEKEFKKKEIQKEVDSHRRNERILSWIFWVMIFSGLSLWLAPGGF